MPKLGAGQMARNLAANLGGMGVSLVASILLVPFLVHRLGVAGYGLVPLINSIANYLTIATIALTVALRQQLSVAVAQRDFDKAEVLFSTSLWSSLAASVLLAVAGGVLSLNVERLISIPAGMETDARILFLTGTAGVILALLSVPLSAPVFCANRLDLKAVADVTGRLTQVTLTFALIAWVAARPLFVGAATAAGAAVGLIVTARLWRVTMPWLALRRKFSGRDLSKMFRIGGWTLAAYCGNLLLQTVDLLLVNRFVGPTEGGMYAAIMQWPNVVRQFGAVVAVVLGQSMAHVYAADGTAALLGESRRAVRIMTLAIAVPVVVLGGSAQPLLHLWLGPSVAQHWWLLVILLVHMTLTLAALPYVTALQAALRVEVVGVATLAGSLGSIGLAIALVTGTKLGMYGIALAGGVSYSLLAGIFIPVHAMRSLGGGLVGGLIPLGKSFVLGALGCASGIVLAKAFPIATWGRLLLHAGLLGMAASGAGWKILLTEEDRARTAQLIRGHFRVKGRA